MVKEGMTFLTTSGMSETKRVTITEVGSEDSAFFEADEGEVELSTRVGEFGTSGDVDELRREIDPEAIHRRRPEAAREADEAKDAEVTTDPLEYARDPSRHDYPGVDTGPRFEESFDGDFDDFDDSDFSF
jgi:hypothetical protein